ncbi:histidine kinase internal region (plasmid) [Gemmatirosa kalamazoonensis]|uniref:Histidine kinase internal region n=1 Tax=Gemmatirosa kalamazoonensis TaxID=861299 RepID=W0RT86_9BACT|nr:histidine kinase [Gemmatirosa kalamazoonensis]AHG93540.1 histidine kinase internal region [Gemmatirosa kalamazoonensis]
MSPLHLVVASVWTTDEIIAAAIRLPVGAAIIAFVYHFVRRVPWPRPFRLRFAAFHIVGAPIAAFTWFLVTAVLEALVPGHVPELSLQSRAFEMTFIGVFMYAIVVGISYAADGSARAARAESVAARTQLAALRSQVQPHFLFNALHTVVQLIPVDPQRAAEAAELVGDLLRATLEEKRDEVTLGDEWTFVSRYLALERIRFGDRLVVHADMDDELLDERVPVFALQTLVENAVRHGAAPRTAATEIVVTAAASRSELMLSVRDSGDGVRALPAKPSPGTGLARLRDRLGVLYGSAASLVCGPAPEGGFEALLVVPRHRGAAS